MKTTEKKLGQEPAYPVEVNLHNVEEQFSQNGPHTIMCHGMSKRFYAACAAMQGILANNSAEITVKNAKDYAEMAYDFADELLKAENL